MRIGVRPDSVAGGSDLPGKMAILARMGYDFFELPLARQEIATLTGGAAAHFRAASEQTGLPILSTSMGHFTDFAALLPDDAAEIAWHIRTMIAFTIGVGADTLLLATREMGDEAETFAHYRAHLLPVAEYARAAGVTLALEHVAPYTPAALARLVAALDHPAVRIYFDTGNCLQVGENPVTQARICAPYTAQLHLKHGPVLPLGAMPLREVRETLEAAEFAGRGCLEILRGDDERERPLWEARGILKMAGYIADDPAG